MAILTQRGFAENNIAQYDDMAGPILVAVLFSLCLLGRGRMMAGSIYGFGLPGCFGIYLIINLLSKRGQYVELYSCFSILGYGLLPFVILAFIAVFYDLGLNQIGWALSAITIAWSTITATRFFEHGLEMEDKKWLIAYPIVLFYSVFALLTVF